MITLITDSLSQWVCKFFKTKGSYGAIYSKDMFKTSVLDKSMKYYLTEKYAQNTRITL